jgi:hypothetical protein
MNGHGNVQRGLMRLGPRLRLRVEAVKNGTAMECAKAYAHGLVEAAQAEAMTTSMIVAINVRTSHRFLYRGIGNLCLFIEETPETLIHDIAPA